MEGIGGRGGQGGLTSPNHRPICKCRSGVTALCCRNTSSRWADTWPIDKLRLCAIQDIMTSHSNSHPF